MGQAGGSAGQELCYKVTSDTSGPCMALMMAGEGGGSQRTLCVDGQTWSRGPLDELKAPGLCRGCTGAVGAMGDVLGSPTSPYLSMRVLSGVRG